MVLDRDVDVDGVVDFNTETNTKISIYCCNRYIEHILNVSCGGGGGVELNIARDEIKLS